MKGFWVYGQTSVLPGFAPITLISCGGWVYGERTNPGRDGIPCAVLISPAAGAAIPSAGLAVGVAEYSVAHETHMAQRKARREWAIMIQLFSGAGGSNGASCQAADSGQSLWGVRGNDI